ncbi:hypothetical protein APS47_12780 [Leptospira kirschneri serovar Mozdok]|nr:hypothetical protein APS47_12780 [Leptospira kirschneri serovar Mozdok]
MLKSDLCSNYLPKPDLWVRLWLTTGEGDMIKANVEIFSDEEIRFFYKIKKDAKLYELVKLLTKVKKDSYELLKGSILKFIK